MQIAPELRDSRILVVDDEPHLVEMLGVSLRYVGFEVASATTGVEALRVAEEFRPDLVVLDVMLPDADGFALLPMLRAGGEVGVLFLTARDSMDDKLHGLTIGGDDYVTKPFSLEEVITRVGVILRRLRPTGIAGITQSSGMLRYADLVLDEDGHEVWRGDQPIHLSPTEFSLLSFLMRNAGRVMSRAQILEHVWHYDFNGDSSVVDSYIRYLRRKVDVYDPPLIDTVRGVGYSLRLPRDRR
ncbi:two-component system response regulator [Microlunatus phosphovorus NM-1]|uniref:Two-component system response regulator n=1 Tax=Microlunatus phosphovorus (strain ATCC 700054 / DSM 10555 / JCM 9379 / NBRC 101784 / NCIMB 13414 / VKM Ac-1990 / NM-1) TaxID=1032480 RepID=F5XFQ9_MICPN|nr:response regulator transcription factor [Microlunatus phosphovorus]BAK35466.1 two-component system response regulator [Microlunatus phosphovorus NM-1]